jgi:tRNA(Ile)-lysidine synthase
MQAFGYLIGSRQSAFAVAVSGGSDSMALLVLAAEFQRETGLPFSVLTVDHGLRPEAKDEAQQVGRVCEGLGVRHHLLRWDRKTDARVSQDAARDARHRLLAEWAGQHACGHIALGHTRDDRLETFLMRARQGSGWHGLGGLLPDSPSPVWPEGRAVMLLRPLLAFGREDLREELCRRGVGWVEDPSNTAERFERVRMRKLLQRVGLQTATKMVTVMDRLLVLRAGVAAAASELSAHVGLDADDSAANVALNARGMVGAEAWLRFVEAMVMAAGGAPHPPRREALERLLRRIETGDVQLGRGVTLAGGKIRTRSDKLVFSKAPPRGGEPAGEKPDWNRARRLLHSPDLRVLSV